MSWAQMRRRGLALPVYNNGENHTRAPSAYAYNVHSIDKAKDRHRNELVMHAFSARSVGP